MDCGVDEVPVTGLNLRYVLSWQLVEAGSMVSLSELVRRVTAEGFAIAGRASKTVSDALRWEVGRGRAVRIGRGLYRAGVMPRQTKSRIRHRVAELRQRVVATRRDTPWLPPRPPDPNHIADDIDPRRDHSSEWVVAARRDAPWLPPRKPPTPSQTTSTLAEFTPRCGLSLRGGTRPGCRPALQHLMPLAGVEVEPRPCQLPGWVVAGGRGGPWLPPRPPDRDPHRGRHRSPPRSLLGVGCRCEAGRALAAALPSST
jgi:hypothetical protein